MAKRSQQDDITIAAEPVDRMGEQEQGPGGLVCSPKQAKRVKAAGNNDVVTAASRSHPLPRPSPPIDVACGTSSRSGHQARLDAKWAQRFEELKAFKANHGHCSVPRRENEPLQRWAKQQRSAYRDRFARTGKASPMTNERVEALEGLGFDWEGDTRKKTEARAEKWYERYRQLKAFKQQHGHCNVPRGENNASANKQLCAWVKEQRNTYRDRLMGKTSPMTNERVEVLEGLGFEWDAVARKEARNAERIQKASEKHDAERKKKASEKLDAGRAKKAAEKRSKSNKMKQDETSRQAALLEEQERLFREAAARVRSQHQQRCPTPSSSIGPHVVFQHPVEDVSQVGDGHWKWTDLHARLGLPQSSSLEVIKKQYRKFCLLYHPDKSQKEDALERFHAVKEAYERLVENSVSS